MFRIIQGDVGSGKTIVSLLSAANVIENKYQCAFMGPTEILATQHYNLAKRFLTQNLKLSFYQVRLKEKKEKKSFII